MSPDGPDIQARLDEIYDLVTIDDLVNAVKRVLDLAREFSHVDHQDEARLLSQRRRMFEDAYRREEIKADEYFDRRNKVARQVLQLARAVVEHLREESGV